MQAALDLQSAIFVALDADDELTGLLGGNRVYDDLPAGTAPPFVRFGASVCRDWGTATEDGIEHRITLEAWSSHDGRKEVVRIAERIRITTLGVSLEGPTISLANMEHQSTRIARDAETDWFSATLNFRAVTETPSS